MNKRNVEQRVLEIVRGLLGTQEVQVNTTLLGSKGVLDSITTVDLIVKLENEFDVTFDEDDLLIESLSSVENIVRFIEGRIKV